MLSRDEMAAEVLAETQARADEIATVAVTVLSDTDGSRAATLAFLYKSMAEGFHLDVSQEKDDAIARFVSLLMLERAINMAEKGRGGA